jgi:putative lipoprotein
MGGRLLGIGADRALAPWDGVFFELTRDTDFRAVGQEPGWLLEIRKAREMRLITAYGADTAVTPVPPDRTDSATGARIYHAVTEAHDLLVLIQPTACTDVMSGESYETTVTITLDGRDLRGCGGPLP